MNKLCRDFDNLLSKKPSEEVLHQFIVRHPVLLNQFGGHLRISKPSLGRDYSADFAVRTTGNYYSWEFIEIERSSHRLFTKKGLPSVHLNTALTQIKQWFSWLDYHEAQGHRDFPGARSYVVVIGNRANLSEVDKLRLRTQNATALLTRIVTWDTLIDPFRDMSDSLVEAMERETLEVISDAKFRTQFKY